VRTLVIGDIHGCWRALQALLAAVDLRPDDRIITLGDYVDRGPNSREVLDFLIDLQQHGNLIALRGNHDQMMVDARRTGELWTWLGCGGQATLTSYAAVADLDEVPERHWQFLENNLVDWHETDTHIFVHATLLPDVPLDEQPAYALLWEKLEDPIPHCSGKVVVCGHTRQMSGVPLNVGHTICLDTNVYAGGWLTCLEVESGRTWQANQKGEVRTGRLDRAS
jgi:serine/threonine protein phosphatase 1